MREDAYREAFEALRASKKYGFLCENTLERVLKAAFLRQKSPKNALKSAKTTLHRLTGAYASLENPGRADVLIGRWRPGDDETLCAILSLHASTRERIALRPATDGGLWTPPAGSATHLSAAHGGTPLAQMDALYAEIFAVTGRPQRVLDCACGLNPVYLAARGVAVLGLDLHGGATSVINRFSDAHGLSARAEVRDLLVTPPPAEPFSLALAMKLLPLLESERAGAAMELLEGLRARFIAVTFPTRTLSGRNIGMEAHYASWLEPRVEGKFSVCKKFTQEAELVYILEPVRV